LKKKDSISFFFFSAFIFGTERYTSDSGDFSNFGDAATLLNPEIVDKIKDNKV
jgi:hypothetical protein